ncbi:MAG: putative signal peptidase [Cyanobacteriota bacterium]|jgi:signal peptidase I
MAVDAPGHSFPIMGFRSLALPRRGAVDGRVVCACLYLRVPMPTQPSGSKPSAHASPEPAAPPRQESLWSNVRVLLIALVVALVVRVAIAEPRYIPSNSMDPTLHIGDRLLVDKLSYRWQPPHRGDIVVFNPPAQLVKLGYQNGQAFIKRIVGEPGDTIQVQSGQVVLNGQPLPETYIAEAPRYDMPALTIPPGYVFVLGDNRNDSNDSHVWGPLPQQNLIGKARLRFWPFDRLGPIS